MLRNAVRPPHILGICLASLFFLLVHSAASPADQAAQSTCRQLKSTGPFPASTALSWITAPTNSDKTKLDRWCATLAPAIFRSPGQVGRAQNARSLTGDRE